MLAGPKAAIPGMHPEFPDPLDLSPLAFQEQALGYGPS
jgi:hypothetical protein